MRKNIKHPVTIIMLGIISSALYSDIIISSNSNGNSNNVSALTYQQSTDLEFTFNSTISLTVSGDLNIEELTPGDSSDSNIIDINVATNNVSGYNLSATVGNTTNPSTNLTHTNNSTYKFTSLTTDTTTPSDFDPNTWGYSYSTDNSTWHYYSNLPLYTATGTTLYYKNNPADDTINFKIAAKALNTQASGIYTNTINFYATANPVTHYYMQDFTLTECRNLATNDNLTIYDRRDENDYTVRYINDACWMTQNLRITGAISAQYSNFEGEDFDVSEYSLDANDANYAGHCDYVNGYNYACSKKSNNNSIGAWYNYYAASAGTITEGSTDFETLENICPHGWTLPTGTSLDALAASINIFSPIYGGYYRNGSLLDVSVFGVWWSSTLNYNTSYNVYYYNGNLGGDYNSRDYGRYIRCIRTN